MDSSNLSPEEAENVVLAVLLTNRNAIFPVSEILAVDDFSRPMRRAVYGTILELFARDTPANIYTVNAAMPSMSLDSLNRLVAHFNRQYEQEVAYLAEVVKTEARRRALREIGAYLSESASTVPAADLEGLSYFGVQMLAEVVDNRQAKSCRAVDVGKELQGDQPMVGVSCNIEWIDRVTYGAIPSHVWTIAGRYKGRKSTLLRNLIMGWCRNGASVDFVSLENRKRDAYAAFEAMLIAERALGERDMQTAHVSDLDVVLRQLTPRQFELEREVSQEIDQWNLRLYDGTDGVAHLNAIGLTAKKNRVLYGTNILAIDYLQKINGKGDYFERVSGAVQVLQTIAIEQGITVVMLAQLNEGAIRNGDDSASSGVKGGGDAAAAADSLFKTIYEEGGDSSKLGIELDKARHAKPETRYYEINPPSGLIIRPL